MAIELVSQIMTVSQIPTVNLHKCTLSDCDIDPDGNAEPTQCYADPVDKHYHGRPTGSVVGSGTGKMPDVLLLSLSCIHGDSVKEKIKLPAD